MISIMEEPITPEDLPKIEKEMKKIINENIEIVRQRSYLVQKHKAF